MDPPLGHWKHINYFGRCALAELACCAKVEKVGQEVAMHPKTEDDLGIPGPEGLCRTL